MSVSTTSSAPVWINRVVSDRVLDRFVRQNLRSFAKKAREGEHRSATTTSIGS